jgi:hypothetical protein
MAIAASYLVNALFSKLVDLQWERLNAPNVINLNCLLKMGIRPGPSASKR